MTDYIELPRRVTPVAIRFVDGGRRVAVVTYRRIECWDARTAEPDGAIAIPEVAGSSRVWAPLPGGGGLLWAGRGTGLHVLDLDGCVVRRLELPEGAAAYLRSEAASDVDGARADCAPANPGSEAASDPGPAGGASAPAEPDPSAAPSAPPVRRAGVDEVSYRTALGIAVSPDGTAAVAAYGAPFALVWDLRTGELLRLLGEERFGDARTSIHAVDWSADGRFIVTRDDGHRLRIWDSVSAREAMRIRTADDATEDRSRAPGLDYWTGVGAVALTPDGSRVAMGDHTRVRVFEVGRGREVACWRGHSPLHPIYGDTDFGPRIHCIRFDAAGRRALTVGIDGSLRVWDVASGTGIWTATPDPCCIAWGDISPDGSAVAWAACSGMRVYPLD